MNVEQLYKDQSARRLVFVTPGSAESRAPATACTGRP
jgi:hypothetical protein